MSTQVIERLNEFTDPREEGKVHHPLATVLFMSICAIFCGAEGWEDIVLWGKIHKKWLAQHVDISNGIPSYSTIRRVFMIVAPHCFGQLMRNSIIATHQNIQPEDHIPIDGKTLRGSKCKAKEIRAIQLVSAWSVENNIILGEVKTNSKSNEVTAIPLLLNLLDLEGSTVSIDAMGCNDKIMQMILAKGAHYVIGLKKNQPTLYAAVCAYAETEGTDTKYLIKDYIDKSHGRCVRRRYFAFEAPDSMIPLAMPNMNTVIATETITSTKYDSQVTAEWRFYITDHQSDNDKLPDYIRNHWQVESMHWSLDVHLNDDRDKKHEQNAAENFARVKRFLLNLVKTKPPSGKKRSVRSRLKMVAWDLDYLVTLLFD